LSVLSDRTLVQFIQRASDGLGAEPGAAHAIDARQPSPIPYHPRPPSRRIPTVEETVKLLRELVELQKASIRLQKFSITLQAEAHALHVFTATGGKSVPALEKLVVRSVRQMRATLDRIEAGRKLPK